MPGIFQVATVFLASQRVGTSLPAQVSKHLQAPVIRCPLYLYISLFSYLCTCLFLRMSAYLLFCLSISPCICLLAYLFDWWSSSLTADMSFYLSVCFVFLSVLLVICLSICPQICLLFVLAFLSYFLFFFIC